MGYIMSDEIIVYPTDTVWGIGGNIYSESIVNKIAKIKKTRSSKPLSVLFYNQAMIEKYFSFTPEFIDKYLRPLSKLETTFCVSKEYLKVELPKWCFFESDFLYFRYLEIEEINEILDIKSKPIFSTSLNITGQAAIVDEDEAYDFFKRNIIKGKFIAKKSCEMSGQSSSILEIGDEGLIKILRKGSHVEQIEDYFNLS